MSDLDSRQAMLMFGILGDALGAKPDRKSISERVFELVDSLHEHGFIIVPRPAKVVAEE